MKKLRYLFSLLMVTFIATACGSGGAATLEKMTDYPTIGDADIYMQGDDRFPTVGTAKVLVFLIDFADYPATSGISKSMIEKAFFGKSEDTGWESLSSFYNKSSNGKLTITGDVFGWYRSSEPSSKYVSSGYNQALFDEVFAHYRDQIDFSQYDSNGSGYVDGCYFVYSRPANSSTNYWGYKSIMGEREFDGTKILRYVWMSRSFFDPAQSYSTIRGIDSETLIHETGHLMGMPDFYDYEFNIGPKGGLGGPAMMDHNTGDHDPFTKMAFGWTEPYYLDTTVKSTTKVKLKPSSTGESLMIAPKFNGSPFNEYILIDYFTPTGLNERVNTYFPKPGIRMYHLGASVIDKESYGRVYRDFEYDNSSTTFKLIKFIEKGGVSVIEEENPEYPGTHFYASENTLYYQGDEFGIKTWTDYYMYNIMYDGFRFSMKVDSITPEEATITIKLIQPAKNYDFD